jgi:outer membrane murein-binding lipoprotein Lpp
MNKKDTAQTLSVRFSTEEKAIIAELRTYYGLSSDNEALRFALRAAKREMERARAQAKDA